MLPKMICQHINAGIAKGVSYPGLGCIPPWARVMKSPESFFCPQIILDGVELKDPSRMTTDPITQCLTCWLELQSSGLQSFKFNNVWNEAKGVYVEAVEQDETVGGIPGPVIEAEGSKQWKGKGRAQSWNEKETPKKQKTDKKSNIQKQNKRRVRQYPPPNCSTNIY